MMEELKDFQEYVKTQTHMYVGSKMATNSNKIKDLAVVDQQQSLMLEEEKAAEVKAEKERIRLLAILSGEIDPDELSDDNDDDVNTDKDLNIVDDNDGSSDSDID